MARSPLSKNSAGRKNPTRMTRLPSGKSFNSSYGPGSSKNHNTFDDADEYGQDDSDSIEVRQVFEEIQKRQAKKSSARSVAFKNHKKILYENARQQTKDIVHAGLDRLEELQRNISELKKQEISYEQQVNLLQPSLNAQDEQMQSMLAIYAPMFDDLFPQRSEITNEASAMVRQLANHRDIALNNALVRAGKQVEASRIERKVAADASQLIKKHKALLQL